jgi:hypothetical protein
MPQHDQKNIYGDPLIPCSKNPETGYFRDGYCHTGPMDRGRHTVCAVMTDDFLSFTAEQGNDLSTPQPELNFPGLTPGDRWCLCAARWAEALDADLAPPVILKATNIETLEIIDQADLEAHAFEG